MKPHETALEAAGGGGVGDQESIAHALDLARALAERLARVRRPVRDPDGLRLARALALNVVDLLEEHAGT